ncbi:MAG: flagellar basal body P-ring formation chaperone FlgA [Acidobacteriia bacterium]|nr:flagellar basal body P-ring formation chaperone FlgA [Terriglobia bacterium]
MMAILLAAASCVAVDGDRILARDLASAAAAFTTVEPDTELGYAPAPGAIRTLHAAELKRMIARHGGTPGGEVGPLCIERATLPLTPVSLEAALRTAVGNPEARIELLDWSREAAPRGEIQFPQGGLAAFRGGEGIWRGYVRYGSSRRFGIWARVRVSVRQQRVVARVGLPAGKPIGPEQLAVEEVDAFPFGAQPAASPDDVVGRVARRSMLAGALIFPGWLEAPQEIHSGDTVVVEVSSGQARLSFEARAAAGGRRGDWIPVRNPATGKTFRARVESAGKVAIGVRERGEK